MKRVMVLCAVALLTAMLGQNSAEAKIFGKRLAAPKCENCVQKECAVQKGAVQKDAVQKESPVQKGAVQKDAVQKCVPKEGCVQKGACEARCKTSCDACCGKKVFPAKKLFRWVKRCDC